MLATALARVRAENRTISTLDAMFDARAQRIQAEQASRPEQGKAPERNDDRTARQPDAEAASAFVKSLGAKSAKLTAREARLDAGLVEAYRAAGSMPDRHHHLAADARVAAYHFAVLLRRQSMRAWHTTVPGLTDDPDCEGDLVKDGLIEQYVEGYFRGNDARSAQLALLARLARHSACLSANQINDLGKDADEAFAELARLYPSTGRDHTLALLVQMLAQPFLLFYDVDKYRVPDSGWYKWFKKYEFLLREGLRAKRQPSKWHGLWLYDRRTGRLLRFTDSDAPRREGQINLDNFFGSIADGERLGSGECSFAEMALRGDGSAGYSCIAHECLRDEEISVGGATNDTDSITALMGDLLGEDFEIPEMNCKGGAGAWGGDSRSSGGKCDSVPQLGALTPAALAVQCATKHIVRPGLENFQCVNEATGMCSSPVDQYTKELQMGAMAGVKLGKLCGPAQAAIEVVSGGSGGSVDEDRLILGIGLSIIRHIIKERQAGREPEMARMTRPEAIDLFQQMADSAENMITDLESQKDQLGEQLLNSNDPQEQQNIEQKLDEIQREINRLGEIQRTAKEEVEKLKGATEKGNDGVTPTDDGTAVARCASETECDDACSGIERSMDGAVACMKQSMEEKPDLSAALNACDPKVCDPLEPTGEIPRSECLVVDDPTIVGNTPKQCWLYRCASDQVATAVSGGCSCAPDLAGAQFADPVREFCAAARCTGDDGATSMRAALTGGSCGCAPEPITDDPQGAGSISLESLGRAPAFLDVNVTVRDLVQGNPTPGGDTPLPGDPPPGT